MQQDGFKQMLKDNFNNNEKEKSDAIRILAIIEAYTKHFKRYEVTSILVKNFDVSEHNE